MDKKFLWAWAIKNSICVICWTVLAIIFHKWWIALFGLLFISGFQTQCKTYRICDKCGKHSPYADSYDEALEKAKKAGWVQDGNKDYCPDCQETEINAIDCDGRCLNCDYYDTEECPDRK